MTAPKIHKFLIFKILFKNFYILLFFRISIRCRCYHSFLNRVYRRQIASRLIEIKIRTARQIVLSFENTKISRTGSQIDLLKFRPDRIHRCSCFYQFLFMVRPPASKLLNRHANIFPEINRVRPVKPVKTILHILLVRKMAPLKKIIKFSLTPPRAYIIFRSCPAKRRVIRITVKINFHFALTPPRIKIKLLVSNNPNVDTQKPSLALNFRQKFIILFKCCRILSAVMRMEIKRIIRMLVADGIIYLKEK